MLVEILPPIFLNVFISPGMLSITDRWIIIITDRKTILVILYKIEPPKLLFAPDRQLKKYIKGYQEVNLPLMPGRYDEQLIELAGIINGQQRVGISARARPGSAGGFC